MNEQMLEALNKITDKQAETIVDMFSAPGKEVNMEAVKAKVKGCLLRVALETAVELKRR